MKTIYSSNSELTETFNRQSQSYGKANSMFFESNILFSYGYHYPLATFIEPETVLINDTGYSVTTSKHIGIAKTVTRNRKQMLTSQIELGQVLLQFEELERKLNKARKPKKYAKQIQELKQSFDENMAYLSGFYIKTKSMFSGVSFIYIPYKKATKEQKEKLDTISKIWLNSLIYTI
jgi:mevalonate kinase